MRILFCNIGWMEYYNGCSEDDNITDGGSFNEENDGCEEYNFRNLNGKYYGYVSQNNLSIHRIKGRSKKVDRANDVLVVWVARHKTLGSVIIGWYKNATVYKEYQEFFTLDSNRNSVFYNIETDIKNGYLLPVEERNFQIPRRNNKIDGICMGQANTWYADEERHKNFVSKVISYIESYDGKFIDSFISDEELEEKQYIEISEEEDLADILEKCESCLDMLQVVNGLIDSQEYKKSELFYYKVNLLLDLGFYDKAIELIESNNEVILEDLGFKFDLAYTYGVSGDNEKSLELFNEFLEEEKEDVDALVYKSVLLSNLDREDESDKVFEYAKELDLENELVKMYE